MSLRERSLDLCYLVRRVRSPVSTARASRQPGIVRWRLRAGGSFAIRGASSDILAIREVILRNTLPLTSKHYDCVVDIGSHVGSFTARVSPFANRVVAFEPVAKNFSMMRDHVGSGGADIQMHPAAVTRHGGPVSMHIHPTNTGRHSLHRQAESEGVIEVPSFSSQEVVAMAGGTIDLLKIDVEGAEREILEDGSLLSATRELLLELNEVNPGDIERVTALVSASGFSYRPTSPEVIHAVRREPPDRALA